MAFLSVMKEALSYGLSKDEVLAILDRESSLNHLTEERRILESRQALESHQHNGNNNHNMEVNVQALFQQCMQQLAHMDTKIQGVYTLLAGIQSQLNQQQQTHQFLTKDDFYQQLQVLDERVTNTVSSVKLSVEQSLQANLQQTFEVIKNNNVSILASSKNQDHVWPKESTGLNNGTLSVPDSDFGVQECPRRHEPALAVKQEETVPEEQDWTVVEYKPSRSTKENRPHTELKAVTWANVAARHADGKSVAGTGPIAETIALQMSQPGRFDLTKAGLFHAGKNGVKMYQDIMTDPTNVRYIPKDGAVIEIRNSKSFQARNEDFFTDYFYTQPKACRVRLRLWFSKGGRLGVQLLVSEGIFDEHHQWPIIFSGNGYVYNSGSRTYSRLWEIDSEECEKPQKDKDVIIGTYVRLMSQRDPKDNVTYDTLVAKRYEVNDRLIFKWDLKAMG